MLLDDIEDAIMVSKKSTSFKNYERQMKIPFIIYVHIEALQVSKSKRSSTILHEPCGFGYSLKCSFDDSLSRYENYYGEDSVKILWEKLENEIFYVEKCLSVRKKPCVLNDEERRIFQKIENCYFCGKLLANDRHEDFDPFTGKFLGAAHQECRDKLKFPNFVPVVMHNLKKYGAHFLLDELDDVEISKVFFPGNDTNGKFGFSKKFQKYSLRFLDSKLFMDETIEDLERILTDSKKKKIRKEFRGTKEFNLMKKKIYFPHCYIDGYEKFLADKLPPRSSFLDRLHDEELSKEDYERIEDIWTVFNYVENEEIKKCCGMKTYVKKKYITKSDYEKCVIDNTVIKRPFMETKAEGHKVQTVRSKKTVLSPGDRKRCILPNGIDTLAWGFQC